jgi:hypothetical protein
MNIEKALSSAVLMSDPDSGAMKRVSPRNSTSMLTRVLEHLNETGELGILLLKDDELRIWWGECQRKKAEQAIKDAAIEKLKREFSDQEREFIYNYMQMEGRV